MTLCSILSECNENQVLTRWKLYLKAQLTSRRTQTKMFLFKDRVVFVYCRIRNTPSHTSKLKLTTIEPLFLIGCTSFRHRGRHFTLEMTYALFRRFTIKNIKIKQDTLQTEEVEYLTYMSSRKWIFNKDESKRI